MTSRDSEGAMRQYGRLS